MTVKLWDVFGKQGVLENLEHNSEVVSCDFHPFLKNELVSTTLGGQMLLWDADQG
jgi:WD40 repeat protein